VDFDVLKKLTSEEGMNVLLKSLKIVDAKSPECPQDDDNEEEAILDAAHADEIIAVAQASTAGAKVTEARAEVAAAGDEVAEAGGVEVAEAGGVEVTEAGAEVAAAGSEVATAGAKADDAMERDEMEVEKN
jgi:hypothetical protein